MDYKMVMLLLINAAIYNKKIGLMEEIWIELDWNYVKEEARQHKCMTIIFPAIERIQEKYNCIDKKLYDVWKNEVDEMADLHTNNKKNIQQIIDKFNENNIEVALFKGEILAKLYPKGSNREAWDIDLLVQDEDKEESIKLLESLGYSVHDKCDKKVVLRKEETIVDMHLSLWKGYEEEKIQILKNFGIENSDKFIDFKGQKLKCKTFDFTKHYEYLICHMIKHFKENGIGIRHLIDITLFYNKYEKEINVELVKKNMELVGYMGFYEAIASLCIVHLGMKKSALTTDYIIQPQMYDKLLNDIFDSGAFGEKTVKRIKLSKMKEKLNNKSWTNRIKNKIKSAKKASQMSGMTIIEKDREELINMLGL